MHNARNPQFPNEEKLWRYRNYAGVVDENKRTFETSTELAGEATLDEESYMDTMCLGIRHHDQVLLEIAPAPGGWIQPVLRSFARLRGSVLGEMSDPAALELELGASTLGLTSGSGGVSGQNTVPKPPPPKPPRVPKAKTPLQHANSATRLQRL